jgi:hypothetical protein
MKRYKLSVNLRYCRWVFIAYRIRPGLSVQGSSVWGFLRGIIFLIFGVMPDFVVTTRWLPMAIFGIVPLSKYMGFWSSDTIGS